MKNVDWKEDMVKYMPVMIGEYEKANIWPEFSTFEEFANVLDEEIGESGGKYSEMYSYFEATKPEIIDAKLFNNKTRKKIENIKGYAFGNICELLQVIAVCNKMLKD